MPTKLLSVSPQFLVQDVVHAAEFYRDALGFHITPFFGDPPSFAIVRRDGVVIQLQHTEKGRGGSNRTWQPESIDAYFWVQEVDGLYKDLVAKGVHTTGDPQVKPWGMKELYVRDPEGYWLCFGEDVPTPTRPE